MPNQKLSFALLVLLSLTASSSAQAPAAAQAELEKRFLAVPDAKRAGEHLRIITAEPHMAGTPGALKSAEYVAARFREAGLETEIVEYKVWMNHPRRISVQAVLGGKTIMQGPTRERVEGDPFQDDPRVVIPFNGYSPSGKVESEVIYANYGRPEDFDKLREMGIDVRGKIVIVRYGQNFRGVKSYVAEERGAAGVIIYSDPMDDGFFRGVQYPYGPMRPPTGVQRGSVQYLFKYPGDPTTPGIASRPDLPMAQRTPPEKAGNLSRVPTTPLSYQDATPIMQNLGGPESPREWQGALPFTYRLGPGPVRVLMDLDQDYQYRSIWNVIGMVPGSELPDQWVMAGNHRDPWVFGAVDPNSGTAAMLETVKGVGELLKSGWKPRRTLVFGSWDAEEQGLVGSTEWAEDNAERLRNAVAYLNLDSAVSGDKFSASGVPSLKQFLREVATAVPSPKGGTVYEVWKKEGPEPDPDVPAEMEQIRRGEDNEAKADDVKVGDLGSGSDYTPFFQHLGISSTDMSSSGRYGVYHSVFDNFEWFRRYADPDFVYLQQMARLLGVQMLRLSQAEVLPFDYAQYGREVQSHLGKAGKKAQTTFARDKAAQQRMQSGVTAATQAAQRLQLAGTRLAQARQNPKGREQALNQAMIAAERALLLPNGLPRRPWYKHSIYAPGEYTGYAAVTLPGVHDALLAQDAAQAAAQLKALQEALERAAVRLEQALGSQ